MPKAREELIELQKRWVNDLKERIYDVEGRHSPELDKYYEEYRREFRQGYERPATREELIRALSKADIVYFGDYHTLKVAQLTVKTLLKETARQYARKFVIGLEMLHTIHQRHADAYLAGRLNENEFLAAIEYQKTWGFDWTNYRILFDLAREHGFKVIGLNRTMPNTKEMRRKSLLHRDRHAASLIAAASMMYPDHLVAALFGDLHTGELHLPGRVREKLADHGVTRNDLIIYQNSETLYWMLVDEGKEMVVDAVKIARGKYCVMNATPLVKFQSHANWQESAGELSFTGLDSLGHEYRGTTDLSQQFMDIVEEIAGFLKIDEAGLDNFKIFTTGDLDFLLELRRNKLYSEDEIENLKSVIAQRHSAFFPRARIIYLGSLSLNDAAEMAGEFIRFTCVPKHYETRREPKDAFYVAIFDDATGVFGALVMNTRYRVATIGDHAARVKSLRGRRIDQDDRIERDVSEMVVAHDAMMKRLINGKAAHNALRSIYQLDPARSRRVTRALGALLGAQMFSAINAGHMDVSEVRALFYEPWKKPGQAYERYLGFMRRFTDLPENTRGLADSL